MTAPYVTPDHRPWWWPFQPRHQPGGIVLVPFTYGGITTLRAAPTARRPRART